MFGTCFLIMHETLLDTTTLLLIHERFYMIPLHWTWTCRLNCSTGRKQCDTRKKVRIGQQSTFLSSLRANSPRSTPQCIIQRPHVVLKQNNSDSKHLFSFKPARFECIVLGWIRRHRFCKEQHYGHNRTTPLACGSASNLHNATGNNTRTGTDKWTNSAIHTRPG